MHFTSRYILSVVVCCSSFDRNRGPKIDCSLTSSPAIQKCTRLMDVQNWTGMNPMRRVLPISGSLICDYRRTDSGCLLKRCSDQWGSTAGGAWIMLVRLISPLWDVFVLCADNAGLVSTSTKEEPLQSARMKRYNVRRSHAPDLTVLHFCP